MNYNPFKNLKPALIGQSNPYTDYVPQPTVYPTLAQPTQTVTPTVPTTTKPVVNKAVTQPAQTNPTIADQYKTINVADYSSGMTGVNADGTPYDVNYQDAQNYYQKQANQPIDEEKIYQDTLKRFQKEIDATNQIYANKLAQQQEVSRGNLGTSTAISARAGALGSPIGEAQYKNVQTENTAVENSILAEQQAVISAILGKGRQEAAKEIADKRAAKEAGVKDYLSFLKDAQVRKTEKLSNLAKSLLAQNIDVKTIDPKQLAEIAKSYGATVNDVINAYNDTSTAELEKLSEGQTLVNPKTGEVIYQAPKTYKPSSGGSGGGLTPYQQFQATQSISKDTQQRTDSAREMARQAQLIDQSYNNIVQGGDRSLNTQAIITSFNKILDPASVVRESEYDRTAQGQSLLSQLEGKVQNIASGGAGVTEKTLKEASDIAKRYLEGAKQSINTQNERARQMATQFGLNPDFVVSTYQDNMTGNPEDDALLASVGL